MEETMKNLGVKALTKDLATTEIHGTTGQDLTEGTLAAGTLIDNVREEQQIVAGDEIAVYHFRASVDGGATWYEQRSYERPDVE